MNKAISQLLTRLKHLRGQHDQRDHAWNRGMGAGRAGGSGKRGGGAGVELGPNQMGPLPTMQMYREQRQQLQQQMRDGVITRTEMQTQLDNLRGIVAKPNRRDDASIVLASKRNVKIDPSGQNDFFNVVDTPLNDAVSEPIIDTPITNQRPKLKPEEIDKVVANFLDVFDESGRKMQDELNAFYNRRPIVWSESEKQDYKDFLEEKGINENVAYVNPTATANWIKASENSGITQEETIDVQTLKPMSSMHAVEIGDLQTEILQKMHHQRAVVVSEMAPEAQDALYEKIVDRIKDREFNKQYGANIDPYDWDLANDAEAIMALTLYGNPDLRLRAIQYVSSTDENGNSNGLPEVRRKYDDPDNYNPNIAKTIGQIPRKNNYQPSFTTIISDAIIYYSLEYRLALALAGKSFTFSAGGYVSQNSDTPRESFIKNFTYTHTSETTTNVLGAAIQTAVSRIGPNADAPPAPSLYPPGITSPEPHPKIIEFLQEQYEETQQEFAAKGITKRLMYRGTRKNVANGIPMSPWSKVSHIAIKFAEKGYFNTAAMLTKYILIYNDQALFQTRYKNEEEYLILETAALEKSDYDILDTFGLPDDSPTHVDWTIKQLNRKRKNGASMFDESNGIVDYSFSSLYEPQYDIFYNYRKKPKAKSTAKELMHRIKKLHNK